MPNYLAILTGLDNYARFGSCSLLNRRTTSEVTTKMVTSQEGKELNLFGLLNVGLRVEMEGGYLFETNHS